MTERPPAPPEGELIKQALKKAKLKQWQAAERAGISTTRWRQIVTGYQSVHGVKATIEGPDETVARMADAVHVTPEQLEGAGRAGAAEALRELEVAKQEAESAALPMDSQARVDERWHMLEALLRQAPVGLSSSEHSALRGKISVFITQSAEWQPPDDAPASAAAEERRPRSKS
jgi:hypothetical protein